MRYTSDMIQESRRTEKIICQNGKYYLLQKGKSDPVIMADDLQFVGDELIAVKKDGIYSICGPTGMQTVNSHFTSIYVEKGFVFLTRHEEDESETIGVWDVHSWNWVVPIGRFAQVQYDATENGFEFWAEDHKNGVLVHYVQTWQVTEEPCHFSPKDPDPSY